MNRKPVVNIGEQRFYKLIEEQRFYIDKTDFIREWWDNDSTVTLITRPRRFGKTLNMSMLECFFPKNMRAGLICLKGFRFSDRIQTGKSTGTCRVNFR